MSAGGVPRLPEVWAPRITRARAGLLLAGGLAATGVLAGALWAWIALPIQGVVALTRGGERVQAYLGNEAEHFFVGPALLIGLLGVVAVVAATLAWQWRPHRGPEMVAALTAGMTAATTLTLLVGVALVHRRYGTIDVDSAPVTPEHRVHYVAEAPPVFFGHTPLQVAASLLLPAATAALVYGFCALWSTRDDLGGYPPEATRPAAAPHPGLTTEGGSPPLR